MVTLCKVDGDEVSDVKSMNAIESLSGEVSDIQSYNMMGGSANVIIRGYSSLTGSNQALFIVDGAPINNDTNTNTTGRGGFNATQLWISTLMTLNLSVF